MNSIEPIQNEVEAAGQEIRPEGRQLDQKRRQPRLDPGDVVDVWKDYAG